MEDITLTRAVTAADQPWLDEWERTGETRYQPSSWGTPR